MNSSTSENELERHAAADNGLEQSIQQRAYELYLNRGEQPGREMEDWLQAEREIKARQKPKRERKEPRENTVLRPRETRMAVR